MKGQFTPFAVMAFKPGKARREVPDPGHTGLYLVIQPSGAKSWAFRYRYSGKPRKLTLGPVYLGKDEPEETRFDQALTLSGARKLASEASHLVAKGIDPTRSKKQQKHDARMLAERSELQNQNSVEAVARLFIEKYAMEHTRESSWRQTARLIGLEPIGSELIKTATGGEVLSKWHGRTVHEITALDVHDLLDRIVSRGSPVTANRVLAAIRKMFAWAVSRRILPLSPCVGVPPPTDEKSRDRVLSPDEIRLVWSGAESIGWPFGPMVQLLMLTLQRRDEVASMRWREINFHEALWIIPKERVKNGVEQQVPLPHAAIEILRKLPKVGGADFVFTATGVTPVSGFSRAKARLDRQIRIAQQDAARRGDSAPAEPIPNWTLHDLRRSGATGLARLGVSLPVVERILNHTSGSFGGVAGIYQRYGFLPEKRKALTQWADEVLRLVGSAGVMHDAA